MSISMRREIVKIHKIMNREKGIGESIVRVNQNIRNNLGIMVEILSKIQQMARGKRKIRLQTT